MSSIFPIRRSVELDEERTTRLVDLDEAVADEVFEALSSGTTRRIFRELHESPQAASDLAETTETSLQNVQYHLEKLTDVDLVEVVDTWYSERGTAMKVYAPTDEALVLFAGRDKEGTLKSLLKRVAAVFAVLLPASALAAVVARSDLVASVLGGSAERVGLMRDADGGAATPAAAEVAGSVDPALLGGLAFFAGGMFVLVAVTGLWVWRQRRRA